MPFFFLVSFYFDKTQISAIVKYKKNTILKSLSFIQLCFIFVAESKMIANFQRVRMWRLNFTIYIWNWWNSNLIKNIKSMKTTVGSKVFNKFPFI